MPPQNIKSTGDKLEHSGEFAKLRKEIIKSDLPSPENAENLQINLINYMLNEQSKGATASYCFCHPVCVNKLFAPRNWEIVYKIVSSETGIYTVRIDSSNKGGQQITALWHMTIVKSDFNDYCILGLRPDN